MIDREDAFVIKIVGMVGGAASPFDDEYLTHYDPDRPSRDRRGWPMMATVVTSPDIDMATGYPTLAEAHQEWTRVSARSPVREDGKPNRPLTAFTVEVAKRAQFRQRGESQ